MFEQLKQIWIFAQDVWQKIKSLEIEQVHNLTSNVLGISKLTHNPNIIAGLIRIICANATEQCSLNIYYEPIFETGRFLSPLLNCYG